MKKYNKWIFNVASGLALTSVIATSCVDEIKFGNSFLEKAPEGRLQKIQYLIMLNIPDNF
mgnify:CR=1 FL=1